MFERDGLHASIYMRQIINVFDSVGDDDKLICILDKGCQHGSVLKANMKMWTAQF